MKRVIVNKNFNKSRLVNTISRQLFLRDQKDIDRESAVSTAKYNYTSILNVGNTSYHTPGKFFIVSKPYIDLLDKVNRMLFDHQLDFTSNVDAHNIRLCNALTLMESEYRNYYWTVLYDKGFITDSELEIAKTKCESLTQIKAESFSMHYDDTNDFFTFKYSSPLKLEHRWDQTINNPGNDDLFLLTIFDEYKASHNVTASDGNRIRTSAIQYYREDDGSRFFQIGFMAHHITERDGQGDIELDHIDKIDYLDSIEINVKLPKSYS